MNKDKQISLTAYLTQLTNRKSSTLPAKHKDHPKTYVAFLDNEIRIVKAQLDAARLEGVTK